jgi:uncharacterized membrane protein
MPNWALIKEPDEVEKGNLFEDLTDHTSADDIDDISKSGGTFGEKLAGILTGKLITWGLVFFQTVFCIAWIVLNAFKHYQFDTYPYPFLGLLLTESGFVITILILIAQNRDERRQQAVEEQLRLSSLKSESIQALLLSNQGLILQEIKQIKKDQWHTVFFLRGLNKKR